MFCRECGTKTNKQGEDFLSYKYQCPNLECRKEYSEKKEWVNNAGLIGTGLSMAGVIWKVANGDYVDAAIKIANIATGNDDTTNV